MFSWQWSIYEEFLNTDALWLTWLGGMSPFLGRRQETCCWFIWKFPTTPFLVPVLRYSVKKMSLLIPKHSDWGFGIFMLPLTRPLLSLSPVTKCCSLTQFLLKLGWIEIHLLGSSCKVIVMTSLCELYRTLGVQQGGRSATQHHLPVPYGVAAPGRWL